MSSRVGSKSAPTVGPEDAAALEVWARARGGSRLGRFGLGPFVDGLKLLVRDPFAVVGIVIVLGFLVLALVGDRLAPYDPERALPAADGGLARLETPSGDHWLGTTGFGKDVLSQLLVGTKVAFIVGFSAAVVVGVISTLLGLLSGYYGRYVDDVIMRATDVALSIPTLPIAIVAVAILGPSLTNIVLVIAVLFWRNGARIVRSVVLTEKEKVYVQAARASGASHLYVMRVHILPNVIPVAFLWMTMSVAFAILAEASLAFIGLGDPESLSWGQMLNEAFNEGSIRTAWWWVLPPSLCLVLLISSIYVIGRAWEEKTNPRLRRL
jgi:peptide/nickel transport system permease protein